MLSRILRGSGLTLTALLLVPVSTTVFAAEGRQIEEVVVTAERRESTVQDTAISITAFTGDFIEDFGLRNQEDLQNYLPATTIQPYDLSVRGVGRLYRALGGDPGIATYFDGAYSEDFGIASTEGGLFDIERIEVLRGPQGTRYARNGLGGAVNFHSKKPTDEFEGEIKTIYGSFDTKEVYGMFSGPLIDGVLNARVTGVKRTRDGFVEEHGPTQKDLNNYGDENYTLSLEWMPTEKLTVYVRGNERSYARMMSGAQGAGAIIVSEMGGMPDPVTGGKRWTSMAQLGWRTVQDPNTPGGPTMCADAVDRSVSDCTVPIGLVPYINGTAQGSIAGTGVYRFNFNGMERFAQPLVAGVDAAGQVLGFDNYAFQANGNQGLIDILNHTTIGDGVSLPDDMDGDDLRTYTNGFNDEYFDHQAAYASVTWDLTDRLTLKYIGGYTDYFYDRTTEDDRTGLAHDRQFFAAQENENYQHEVQMFLDIGDNITLTGGLFMYENDIDQQLDFYHTDSWSKYTDPINAYGPGGVMGLFLSPVMVNHRSAQNAVLAGGGVGVVVDDPATPQDETFGGTMSIEHSMLSQWLGDNFANTGRTDGDGPGRVDRGTVAGRRHAQRGARCTSEPRSSDFGDVDLVLRGKVLVAEQDLFLDVTSDERERLDGFHGHRSSETRGIPATYAHWRASGKRPMRISSSNRRNPLSSLVLSFLEFLDHTGCQHAGCSGGAPGAILAGAGDGRRCASPVRAALRGRLRDVPLHAAVAAPHLRTRHG